MTDATTGTRTARASKFTSLEAGRAFAALIVVLFHCNETGVEPKYFGHEVLPFFRGGYSGVEFFFVLSGFVMVVAHRKDLSTGRGVGRFLWKRFQRLYPTLWAVVVPLVVVMLVGPTLRWADSLSAGDVVASLTAAPFPHERVLSVEWTLRYEVVFYLLFAMTIRWRRLTLLLWLVWCVVGVTSLWFAPHGILSFVVAPYPLIFVAGMIVGLAFERIPARVAIASLTIGSAVYLAWLAHLAASAVKPDKLSIDALGFGVGAALIVAGLAILERSGKIAAPRILCFLGAASYSIYLVHYPAMSVLMKLAMKLRAMGTPDYAAITLVLLTAVGAGVMCHLVVEKPLLKATRRLGDWYSERRRIGSPVVVGIPLARARVTILAHGLGFALREPVPPFLRAGPRGGPM
ncbi:acyltransferase family protein [Mycobacterium malmoense]|uniref:acyltransferase family protein n=1 Tax=Mycobacterium malmoense TaxID=1780 RepID=UPI0015A5F073|nr:acyltransferase [Mycobacterium malmoense]